MDELKILKELEELKESKSKLSLERQNLIHKRNLLDNLINDVNQKISDCKWKFYDKSHKTKKQLDSERGKIGTELKKYYDAKSAITNLKLDVNLEEIDKKIEPLKMRLKYIKEILEGLDKF